MKAFKLFLMTLVLAAVLGMISPPALAWNFWTGHPNAACNSVNEADRTNPASSPVCQEATSQSGSDVNPVVRAIQITTSVMALIAGFVAIIMIIAAGLQFVTSGGNDEAVANAKKKIRNTIVGLVLIALAWTIVRLVTDAFIK
jgi:Mn2+/Fe2+ NRAMP family transporter